MGNTKYCTSYTGAINNSYIQCVPLGSDQPASHETIHEFIIEDKIFKRGV